MASFHTPVSFGKDTDSILDMIEASDPEEAHRLLAGLEEHSKSDFKVISHLALATAKWIDHSGPYIGHGILNADPILRSIGLMNGENKGLPLLQMTMYVTDLLRDQNYGPYVMMGISSISHDSRDETSAEFSKAVRSGSSRYLAEKLLSGLHSVSGKGIREDILYEALMQYGQNEHRLLLPFHTLRLLDRDKSWKNAVAYLRPSVQYLSSNPDTSHGAKAEQLSKLLEFGEIMDKGDSFDQESSYDLTRMLLNSVVGNEMTAMVDYSKTSSLADYFEAIALSSTILLLNSDLEQHSVTGKHCTLSIMRDRSASERVRKLALLSSMEGPRARRIKAYILKSLDAYMKVPEVPTFKDEEEHLDKIEAEIARGQQESAFRLAGSYVRSGFPIDGLARRLLSICFRTEGPFESLHTSKMIVGMRDITVDSKSDMRWIHLAASARFIAGMVKKEKAAAKKVMEKYRKYLELSGSS